MTIGLAVSATKQNKTDNSILAYIVHPKKQDIKLYWKDDSGSILQNFENLKTYVEQKNSTLIFAMNGGMFTKDYSPQGLFIQDKKTKTILNEAEGKGNFYLKPNGVFYITTNNVAFICNTTNFIDNGKIKYATQSGPMLLINGKIHPAFNATSTNLNIRNGVGILPNNKVVFAMSKTEINFYHFAEYFKKLGCKNALYLDGFVSRTYFPEKKWIQMDGSFGVIIGITARKTTQKNN